MVFEKDWVTPVFSTGTEWTLRQERSTALMKMAQK